MHLVHAFVLNDKQIHHTKVEDVRLKDTQISSSTKQLYVIVLFINMGCAYYGVYTCIYLCAFVLGLLQWDVLSRICLDGF